MNERATRRELLVCGLAATGAGSALAAGANVAAATAATTDAELILPLVGTEMLAAFTYQHAIASGLLSTAGNGLAGDVLAHERTHAQTLERDLLRLGGSPPPPLSKISDADRVLAAHQVPGDLGSVRNEHDWLILLSGVELLLEASYMKAISKLADQRALRVCLEIVPTEAQHGAALSELLHPGDVKKAVPSSFVSGRL